MITEVYQGYFELDEAPPFLAMDDLTAWDSFFSEIKVAEDEAVPNFERIHLNREVDLMTAKTQ